MLTNILIIACLAGILWNIGLLHKRVTKLERKQK
jgi:hypothetical protein